MFKINYYISQLKQKSKYTPNQTIRGQTCLKSCNTQFQMNHPNQIKIQIKMIKKMNLNITSKKNLKKQDIEKKPNYII